MTNQKFREFLWTEGINPEDPKQEKLIALLAKAWNQALAIADEYELEMEGANSQAFKTFGV